MYTLHLASINQTITYKGMICEEDLLNIDLTQLDEEELQQLLSRAAGYAEDLILFELESRSDEEK